MFHLLVYNTRMALPFKELSESALDALITRERTRVVAPLTEWHTLSAQLAAEGVLRPAASSSSSSTHSTDFNEARPLAAEPRRRGGVVRWGSRMIAGALLLGTGVIVGRGMTVGQNIVPIVKQAIADAETDSVSEIKSTAQAKKVLARSEKRYQQAANQYQRAAGYLAARDTSAQIVGGPEVYQDRLAALDQVLATTREKLQTTPADPLLNQYYQSAFGAREATIQQLGQTLPAGARITHY
jgi:hypothetical protein